MTCNQFFVIWIRRTSSTPFSWSSAVAEAVTVAKGNLGFPWRCHGPRRKVVESVTRGKAMIDAKCMVVGV